MLCSAFIIEKTLILSLSEHVTIGLLCSPTNGKMVSEMRRDIMPLSYISICRLLLR